ncbi:MAG: hypothetical protein LBQ24_06110 [Candidatus Peribacteria bacterium]|jgi:hypothetical protein|nr:hypothetical protein [Candidatus Peribacteria bacterium]
MTYIQRLQEEWEDKMERTTIIIEFENFVLRENISSSAELIDLAEALLIE